MTKKSISTNVAAIACDVCGRTLLRGEHADLFLHGGERKTVCELCTSRAVHEGWIREGLDDVMGRRPTGGRGRSLLGRLRQRRVARETELAPPDYGDAGAVYDPAAYDPEHYDPTVPALPLKDDHDLPDVPGAAPAPIVAEPALPVPAAREPRNVHAVPTNADLKVSRALEVFNAGPHRRTVAGVARSLGAPIVSALPSATEGSIVSIVVAWELSWYRYEVDLGDEAAGVRVVAQGTELDELAPQERLSNALADDAGELHPATAHG